MKRSWFQWSNLVIAAILVVAAAFSWNFLSPDVAEAVNSSTVLAPNDSSIDSANPTDNDGQDPTVRVSGGVEVGLFKFSTSSLGLPVGATIDAVDVQLFIDPSTTNVVDDTASAYWSTNFTSEDTVTWNTDRPTKGALLATRTLFNSSGVLRPSVTFRQTCPCSELNTSSPTTVWVESNTSARVTQFESHENGTQSLRPILWVEYTPSGGTTTSNPTTTTSPAGTKKIYAAGDICDPDAASCQAVGNLVGNLLDSNSYWVPLGDYAYKESSLTLINTYYAPWFGSSTSDPKGIYAKTWPVEGNHEQLAGSGNPTGYCVFFGDAKTDCNNNQVYSQDLGTWRLIVVESNGSAPTAGELSDFQSLVDAANTAGDNIVVASHKMRWTSPCSGCHDGVGLHEDAGAHVDAYWDYAYDHGVDLSIAAHDHKFEAFDTLNKNGDAVVTGGLGSIVSGLGGAHPDSGCDSRRVGSLYCAGDGAAANDYSENDLDGVLKLDLGASAATATFILEDGTTNGQVKYTKSYPTR